MSSTFSLFTFDLSFGVQKRERLSSWEFVSWTELGASYARLQDAHRTFVWTYYMINILMRRHTICRFSLIDCLCFGTRLSYSLNSKGNVIISPVERTNLHLTWCQHLNILAMRNCNRDLMVPLLTCVHCECLLRAYFNKSPYPLHRTTSDLTFTKTRGTWLISLTVQRTA